MNVDESLDSTEVFDDEEANGTSWSISHYVMTFLDVYGLSFLQHCISILYAIYIRCTFFNVLIFTIKYVPTGIYMYKFLKNMYVTSRERIKEKQLEMEDIQLQIQIVNTKLCVRDAEFSERASRLRRETARLRRVRGRVRDLIAADDVLRRALHAAAECDTELDLHVHATQQEDNEFIMELLKGMKRDHIARSEMDGEKIDCGEHGEQCDNSTEQSIYSSISDMDVRQDCKVKIVKVTNVYKVAYLKHYIKQKRLRRACQRAALKKKMETIKQMLEDWQKTLNMVINSKLTILNIDAHPMDMASQEAMGDYSKPQEYSDSDSDLRSDVFYDEGFNWSPSSHRPYMLYTCEDVPDQAVSREYYEPNNGDVRYTNMAYKCKSGKMASIVEETGSQIAIQEVPDPSDECRDLVAI